MDLVVKAKNQNLWCSSLFFLLGDERFRESDFETSVINFIYGGARREDFSPPNLL